jgi:hypothetical protein
MQKTGVDKRVSRLAALASIALAAALMAGARAGSPGSVLAQGEVVALPAGQAQAEAAVSPALQYQARLTNPATGLPVPDGQYILTFKLYDVPAGGSFLWTEVKEVTATTGLVNTVLGDTAPFNSGLFDGRALWLGVKVGADAEASPRQPVLPVAYALGLAPGATVAGGQSSPSLLARNTGAIGDGLSGASAGSGSGVRGSATGAGYGGTFTGAGGRALYASGSVTVTGDVNVGGSVRTADGTSLPVAYAYVYGGTTNVTLGASSGNVSVIWNNLQQMYVINIAGHPFSYGQYIVSVTVAAGCGYIAGTTEYVGDLAVQMTPPGGGSPGQCEFQFVVYQP